jgi:hypothetical protein
MSETIELYRYHGPTDIIIRAEFTDDGDLKVWGHDLGEAPRKLFDHDDYEYWTIAHRAHKDRVLFALLEKLYGNDPSAVLKFKELLKTKDIPCEFGTWP